MADHFNKQITPIKQSRCSFKKIKPKLFNFRTKLNTSRAKVYQSQCVEYQSQTVTNQLENTYPDRPYTDQVTSSVTYHTKIFKTLTKLITPVYTIYVLKATYVTNQIKNVTNRKVEANKNNKLVTTELLRTKSRSNKTESMQKRTKRVNNRILDILNLSKNHVASVTF